MDEIVGKVMLINANVTMNGAKMSDEELMQALDELIDASKSFVECIVAERNKLFGERFGERIYIGLLS